MTKALVHSIHKIQKLNTKVLFFVILGVLLAMFGLYVFLVNMTIMNVVAREHVQSTVSSLSSNIGSLEFKYITLKNSVTLDLAHAKGFNDVAQMTFVSKTSKTGALSYNSSL